MNDQIKKINIVKNMVLRSFVKHSEIKPRLKNAGLNENLADQIAELSINYRYKIPKSVFSKLFRKIPTGLIHIIRIAVSSIAGFIAAEYQLSKIINNSLLNEKLTGAGDKLLFWLGLKTVNLNINMLDLMEININLLKNSYKVLTAMIIGFAAAYILWTPLASVMKFFYRRSKLTKNIKDIIFKYSYTIDQQYKKIISDK